MYLVLYACNNNTKAGLFTELSSTPELWDNCSEQIHRNNLPALLCLALQPPPPIFFSPTLLFPRYFDRGNRYWPMLKCHSLHLTQADYTNLSPSASLRSLSGDYHKMVLFSLFLRFFYTCLRDYCACPRDTHTTSSIGSSKGEPTTIRHRNPLCICLRSFQINCLSQLSSKTEHIVFGYARVQCSGGFD